MCILWRHGLTILTIRHDRALSQGSDTDDEALRKEILTAVAELSRVSPTESDHEEEHHLPQSYWYAVERCIEANLFKHQPGRVAPANDAQYGIHDLMAQSEMSLIRGQERWYTFCAGGNKHWA
jgi:hypothetical protein